MAQFPKLQLTRTGKDALIKSASGNANDRLIITKLKLGDGEFDGDVYQLKDLVSTKLEVKLNDFKDNKNGVAICEFIYDNSKVERGFNHREIGLFGKNGDGGAEILLSYSNAGNKVSYMPDKNTPIPLQTIKLTIAFSENEHVIPLIDLSNGITISKATELIKTNINQHNTDPNAHGGLKTNLEGQITNHNANNTAHQDIRNLINATKSELNSHKTKAELDHPNSSVKTKHIADKAITSEKIADGAVYGAKLAPQSVNSRELAPNSVGSGNLASNSVTAKAILNKSVTPEKLDREYLEVENITISNSRPIKKVVMPLGIGAWLDCMGQPLTGVPTASLESNSHAVNVEFVKRNTVTSINGLKQDTSLNELFTYQDLTNIDEMTPSELGKKGFYKHFTSNNDNARSVQGLNSFSTILGWGDRAGKTAPANDNTQIAISHIGGGEADFKFRHITTGFNKVKEVPWTTCITDTARKQVIKGDLTTSNFNVVNRIYVPTSKISVDSNNDQVPSTKWVNDNTVKSIDGKKGNTTIFDILFRYGGDFDVTTKTGSGLNKLGYFRTYITNSDLIKKLKIPTDRLGVLTNTPWGTHTTLEYKDNDGNRFTKEVHSSNTPDKHSWDRFITNTSQDQTINGKLIVKGQLHSDTAVSTSATMHVPTEKIVDNSTSVPNTAWIKKLFSGEIKENGWVPLPNGLIIYNGEMLSIQVVVLYILRLNSQLALIVYLVFMLVIFIQTT